MRKADKKLTTDLKKYSQKTPAKNTGQKGGDAAPIDTLQIGFSPQISVAPMPPSLV